MDKKVYIIILNWNGWKDTLECLESVFKLSTSKRQFKVVVCDNGSKDKSVENIKNWAEGKIEVECKGNNTIRGNVYPITNKPISYDVLDKQQINRGVISSNMLTIIRLGTNLGFAGGNNVGINYALNHDDCGYVWILNNDTVVDKSALDELCKSANSDARCIYGSLLCSYYDIEKIQLGNKLNKFFGTTKGVYSLNEIGNIDFLVGASLFIPRLILEDIGLLSEEYFLYYEEPDYWQRSKSKYRWICNVKSIVYHKEGATIGASSKTQGNKSMIGDFYSIRNRRLFMKKYYPNRMVFVYFGLVYSLFTRLRRKQYNRLKMIIKIILNPMITYNDFLFSK
jgi:GT2 family glycosyltransferase